MKQIQLIILLGLLIASNYGYGQALITKNDSIPSGKDSIAILTIPKYRGNVVWQQSLDNKNWLSSNIVNKDSFEIPLGFKAFYRAKIVDGTCEPIYSEELRVRVADSVKTVLADNMLEKAYPDSIGQMVYLGNNDTLLYTKINGEYVWQGDIILSQQQVEKLSGLKGGGIGPTNNPQINSVGINLWPDKKVYYRFDNTFSNSDKEFIRTVINQEWQARTTLKFIEITQKQEFFIDFTKREDINRSSCVPGMVSGGTKLTLSSPLQTGTIIHEIGHAIGLIHEHSRPDCDQYILKNWNNIKEGTYNVNFQTLNSNWGFIGNGLFDFYSIMGYPSKNTGDELEKDVTLWSDLNYLTYDPQRNRLTVSDIEMINILYQDVKIITGYPDIPNISSNSINTWGYVECNMNYSITSIGLCWSKNRYPTISGLILSYNLGCGKFTSTIPNLESNTIYWVRAFANTNNGVFYGNEYRIKTLSNSGTFVDTRDLKTYKWVRIGNQIWMAENLAFLPTVYPAPSGSGTSPYYYVYDYSGNNPDLAKLTTNYKTHGVLYNWQAAKTACPVGWHLPTDYEWKQMEMTLGMTQVQADINEDYRGNQGFNLKSETSWDNNGNGDNKSGFKALASGFRKDTDGKNGTGYFEAKGKFIGFWTSSLDSKYNTPFLRGLDYRLSGIARSSDTRPSLGLCVRCVKN